MCLGFQWGLLEGFRFTQRITWELSLSTKQQLNAAAAKQNAAAQMQNAGAQKVAGAAAEVSGAQAAKASINWKKLLVVSKFLPHLMFVALAVGTVIYAVKKLSEAEAERRKKAYETYAAINKTSKQLSALQTLLCMIQ